MNVLFLELGARVVIAAAARAGAKCNKGVEVLSVLGAEHFVHVLVKVTRGGMFIFPAKKCYRLIYFFVKIDKSQNFALFPIGMMCYLFFHQKRFSRQKK